MFTGTMWWFPVAVLLLALLVSLYAGYRIALEMEVCVAAIVVFVQAIHVAKDMWGMGFITLAVLFNPAMPVPLRHRLYPGMEWFSIGAYLISLAALRTRPLLCTSSVWKLARSS